MCVSIVKNMDQHIKVHMATSWTIIHGLMLLWFTDLMKVTEEVTIHRPSSIFKDATMMRTRTFKRLLFFRNLKKINTKSY